MTTGSNNTILGAYSGNQGGLDIRTASNYIVLSDGDGNPRGYFDNSGTFYINTTDRGIPQLANVNAGSYAQNATVDFPAMSGMIIVNNWNTGAVAIWIVGAGTTVLVSSLSSGGGVIAFNGSLYQWTNNSSSTGPYTFTAIRTRSGA
jgi:hypothetical protein